MNNRRTLKTDWRGNFVATVTPFDEKGMIDEEKFVNNLKLLMDEGADGFVVSGCTGESWAMTHPERKTLFELAVNTVANEIPIIAGVSDILASDVVALSLDAKRVGVAGVLVLPPYFALPGRGEVLAHFRSISEGAECPIMIYNNPRRTGINLEPDILKELAEIDHVVAVKESSSDFVQTERTIQDIGDRLAVFTGHSAERGFAAALMGVDGFVSSGEPQIMGSRALSLWHSTVSGELETARQIQFETLAVQKALSSVGGSSPADLKAAMNLLGRPGGYPRPPLLPLSQRQLSDLKANLDSLGLAGAGG